MKIYNKWRVYDFWCWGNESQKMAEFDTKKEAEDYIKTHGKLFDGFEGMDIGAPYIVKDDGTYVFME